jgi:DNA (cytosine-5)-methyltransferase 1
MTKKLKVLDLFSGLGGFSLGLERTGHFETVAFCDNDKFSKLILDKHWKGKKVYEDVREITKEKLIADGIELPDVVTGGFPCQPFSVAGKQKGTSDDRHLWPEMFRIIKTLQPRIVVGENVRGIVNIQDGMVFETVCTNLEDEGYEVQAFNIPAAGVGAPHRRERIWFIATLGDPKYDGPLTDEIGRRNKEINGGTEKRQNSSFEFERTNRREDNATMENSNNNGFERGFSEARNETITGEKSSSNGSEDTDNSSRRSDGRGDQIQPRTDGTIQGLRNGDEEESSRATGVRGLHEGTDIGQGTIREDRDNKDDNRTLVQTRQSRVQSSEHRGLGENQTSLENNQVRQRDDSSSLDRMEERTRENVSNTESERTRSNDQGLWQRSSRIDRGQRTDRSEINVANTNDEGVRTRIGGSDNDYETESRSRGTDGGRSTSDDERHNIASTEIKKVDVANTESFGSRETRYSDQEERSEGSRATQLDGSRGDVANANGERSQRTKQSETHRGETETQLSTTQSITTEGNHWEFEPDVGRVAYGVPGRVHRLKALGNSIVPKIVEEIGYALIKGMK